MHDYDQLFRVANRRLVQLCIAKNRARSAYDELAGEDLRVVPFEQLETDLVELSPNVNYTPPSSRSSGSGSSLRCAL